MTNFSQTAAFIWSVADLLRGDFKQSQYGRAVVSRLHVSGCHHLLVQPQVVVLAGIKTMDTDFCIDAIEEALQRHGAPEILKHADQGAQFTSEAFTGVFKEHGIRISMDGQGLLP